MSRIVCNTGPLIALGLLQRLDLLQSLFAEVLIPEAVAREVNRGGANQQGVDSFRSAGWIRVVPPAGDGDMLLESLLDAGEAAVINLAREQGVTPEGRRFITAPAANFKPLESLARRGLLLPVAKPASPCESLQFRAFPCRITKHLPNTLATAGC